MSTDYPDRKYYASPYLFGLFSALLSLPLHLSVSLTNGQIEGPVRIAIVHQAVFGCLLNFGQPESQISEDLLRVPGATIPC